MGVSFSAHAGLGVLIKGSQLYTTARVRGCEHPDSGGRFCPQCAAAVWVEVRSPIPGYEPEGTKANGWVPNLCGLRVVTGTDDGAALICCDYVTAHGEPFGDHRSEAMLVPAWTWEQAKADVRRVLEPLGLWDESKFGYWVLADVSY
jgi:hypothetical protein